MKLHEMTMESREIIWIECKRKKNIPIFAAIHD